MKTQAKAQEQTQEHPSTGPRFDQFMTFEQVAQTFGVKLGVVRGWRDKGMPWIQLDARRSVVYEPDFAEWLLTRKVTGDRKSVV